MKKRKEQMHVKKRERVKEAYGMKGMISATWGVGDSKISGAEPPLEVHFTQDKT